MALIESQSRLKRRVSLFLRLMSSDVAQTYLAVLNQIALGAILGADQPTL
jgi:hypothetical protein